MTLRDSLGRPRIVKRRKPRRGVLKDAKYLAWIRSLPCIICQPNVLQMLDVASFTPIVRSESAHAGTRGLGQKCSDRETLPLCKFHHRTGPESHHVLGKGFWEYQGLDRWGIIAELQRLYEEYLVQTAGQGSRHSIGR